ncbi:MAG: hypothetical protein A2X64_11435 [Ignavibacteria bacterium GWF2_33_9]|nr:MAG: hypothetical protein A2X64_11435 [Ignavibacteria bacterium GWF2_33_9]
MKYRILLAFGLLLFITRFAFTAPETVTYYKDGASEYLDRIVNFKHITANVKFKPVENLIFADVEFQFSKLRHDADSLVFYCPDFKFESITLENQPVIWKVIGKNVQVNLPFKLVDSRTYSIKFKYFVQPFEGAIYFVGWDDEKGIRRKQIWAHRPHGWLPYADARLTTDFYIEFDGNFKVASNGERVSIDAQKDGNLVWHYRMNHPHPYFSTALVIGKMDYKSSKTKDGVPVELWYFPDQEDKFEETYRYSEDMIDFFDKELGMKYPWELYRQIPLEDYMYGGMETTTSTVFGSYMFINRRAFWQRNYINVNAHELNHQWFGNYIVHSANADVWLTESFATYYAKLFEKEFLGKNDFDWQKVREYQKTMEAAEKNDFPVGLSMGGVERIYQKGSLVLEMLRKLLGDEDFRKSITTYLNCEPYNGVETADLLKSIYKVTGKDLKWFFDEWVFRGGEPNFKIKYDTYTNNGKNITQVKVDQIHSQNDLVKIFKMPVTIDIYYTDKTKKSGNFQIDSKTEIFEIENPAGKQVEFIVFDPDRKILKKTIFDRTYDELASQALKADNMLDRYDAVLELAKTEYDKKKKVFAQVFEKEDFHLIKSEIIKQIDSQKDSTALSIFNSALRSGDQYVHQSLVDNVKLVPKEIKQEYEKLLKDTSYYNVEIALENLCNSFPEDISKYLKETEDEVGWRGMNIRMKWLEIAIGIGQKKYINELKDYTSVSYDFEARMNSLYICKRLNIFDEEIARNILLAAIHWNSKLRIAGRDVLNYFSQQTKCKEIFKKLINSYKWTPYQKEQVVKLGI